MSYDLQGFAFDSFLIRRGARALFKYEEFLGFEDFRDWYVKVAVICIPTLGHAERVGKAGFCDYLWRIHVNYSTFLNYVLAVCNFVLIFFWTQKSFGVTALLWHIPFWAFICLMPSAVFANFPLTGIFSLFFHRAFGFLFYPIGKLLNKYDLVVIDDLKNLDIDNETVGLALSTAVIFQLSVIIGSLVQSGLFGFVGGSWGIYFILKIFW